MKKLLTVSGQVTAAQNGGDLSRHVSGTVGVGVELCSPLWPTWRLCHPTHQLLSVIYRPRQRAASWAFRFGRPLVGDIANGTGPFMAANPSFATEPRPLGSHTSVCGLGFASGLRTYDANSLKRGPIVFGQSHPVLRNTPVAQFVIGPLFTATFAKELP